MKFFKLAKMIRSKNAGPFEMSLDILYGDYGTYKKVLDTGVVTPELISTLYDVPVSKVQYYEIPLACAVKFSFPRRHPSGDFHDTDIYGCQFHAPLVELEIPVE